MNNTIDILLAEDEELIAKLVSFKLSKEGYTVTHAKDGQTAIDLLKAKPWSLIILDIFMPVCNGWQVLKQIRAIPALSDVPVLILTAKNYSHQELVPESEMGAQQYLKKPFDPNDLAKLVKRMIKTDPEFDQLKKEFISSLPERREKLMRLALKLREICIQNKNSPSDYADLYKEIQMIIHRIAGVAEPFGFNHLSKLCCDMDDWLDESEREPKLFLTRLEAVIQALQ